ncbi:unnamed protein product [Parnassius apollo]|uniref:(apollo) hypothetical protein n=1 Tax=Parnassius apollo TaxID=110799 RepID=A0A8S3WBQ8_PARAO|nr:unnamed protein product [Parnassius apollo]
MCDLISTFVFFDIETTGLPHQERNQTKITELTFVAVSAIDIECTAIGSLPLVNKLSLLFNPQRKINPEVVRLTGLSKSSLAQQPVFKSKIKTLNSFLEELPKPVCLVAHNGNRFDFKILSAEYKDADAKFPEDLLCVDSLIGFKKVLKDDTLYKKSQQNNVRPVSTSSPKIEDILTDDEGEWPELNASVEEWQQIDELTRSLSNISCDKVKDERKCFERNNVKGKEVRKKVSYALSELYRRLLKKEPAHGHRAEVDCMMLLECVIATKSTFLPWANKFSKLLSQVTPLQR